MKRLFILLSIVLVLVSIVNAELTKSKDNENLIIIDITKGWNLVPSYMNMMDVELFVVNKDTKAENIYFPKTENISFPYPDTLYNLGLSGGGLERKEATFIKSGPFYLDTINKEYITSKKYGDIWLQALRNVYSDPSNTDPESTDLLSNMDISGLWIYATENLRLVTRTDFGANLNHFKILNEKPFSGVKMYKGWNFFSITPDLVNKALQDIEGDCKITKMAVWDSEKQNWQLLTYQTITFPNSGVGGVLAIKVSDNCKLSSQSTAPPPVPE